MTTKDLKREIKRFEKIVKMSLDGLIRKRWIELKNKLQDDRKELEQRTRILEGSFRRKAQKYAFLEKKYKSVILENTLLKKSVSVTIIEQKAKIASLEAEISQIRVLDLRLIKDTKEYKKLEDELDEQANWIADNYRLISTLNEDRNKNLEKIKALEAENEKLKAMAEIDKNLLKIADRDIKSSLTREEAEGIIDILEEKATGSEDEMDEAVNSGINIGINAIKEAFKRKAEEGK